MVPYARMDNAIATENCPRTLKLWPWPIFIILHDIWVAIPDSTKIDQKSEKNDQKNEWGPMKKWSQDSETLAMAYPHHITRYMCCDKKFFFFGGI